MWQGGGRRPVGIDDLGFVVSRPGRGGAHDESEGFAAVGTALKSNSKRDSYRDPGAQMHDFLLLFGAAPELTLSPEDVPDLMHGFVPDRQGDAARRQAAMHHAGVFVAQQDRKSVV